MSVLDTKHKRKSAAITALILLLLIFVIFNYGMRYLDPPEEYGLAINFGDSNVGSEESVQKPKKVSTSKAVEKEEAVQQVKETPKEVIKEEIIANDTSEAIPVVEKVKEEKKETTKEVVKKETPKPKPKPKLSKETTDALSSLLNGNASDGQPNREVDNAKEGMKGNEKGDLNAKKYYENTGSTSGGNYNLEGRKVSFKAIVKPDCQEQGVIVVRIMVDNTGKVISAEPGEKGSTNKEPCLLKAAKEAALKTKWNAVSNARLKQTGTIIYKFSLSK